MKAIALGAALGTGLMAGLFFALWADYLATWTAWNHVRTAVSLAALALLIIGLS